jgi:hypothetical protein
MRLFHASQPSAGAAARRTSAAAPSLRPAAAAAPRPAAAANPAPRPSARTQAAPTKAAMAPSEDALLAKLRYQGITPKDSSNLTPEEAYAAAAQVVRERLVDAFDGTHKHWALSLIFFLSFFWGGGGDVIGGRACLPCFGGCRERGGWVFPFSSPLAAPVLGPACFLVLFRPRAVS